jgi:hypothetical protein
MPKKQFLIIRVEKTDEPQKPIELSRLKLQPEQAKGGDTSAAKFLFIYMLEIFSEYLFN